MQNEWFEKIELYLDGELKGEELALFEKQLKEDDELKQQVDLYKTIENEMKQRTSGSKEEEDLKKSLSDLGKKYFAAGTTAKVIPLYQKRKWLYVAAAAVLLIMAGGYWYFFSGHKNNDTLYAQYAAHQPLSLQRDSKDTARLLQDAIKAFNAGNYAEALTGLNAYLQTDSSDAELLLAKNICLTETGSYDEAIDGFNKLMNKNEIFKYQAVWYKALAYLKQDKKAECKETLESIPANADTYLKAKELLKEL